MWSYESADTSDYTKQLSLFLELSIFLYLAFFPNSLKQALWTLMFVVLKSIQQNLFLLFTDNYYLRIIQY